MSGSLFRVILIFALAAGSLLAENGGLTVRNAHSMAYVHSEGEIFLFGGADERRVFGDLWVLRGGQWVSLNVKGPSPRTFAGLTPNTTKDGLLLFGGNRVLFGNEQNPAAMLDDTWEFKNGEWKQLVMLDHPEARAEAALVLDEKRNRIVLFGGYRLTQGEVQRMGDTWEFRNGRWRKIASDGPSPRNGASTVWDPTSGNVVLFGGSTDDRQYGPGTGETWVLNGSTWRKVETPQPPNIFNSAMTGLGRSDRILRFGGYNGTNRIAETWIYADHAWMRIGGGPIPPPRNHASIAYDRKLGRAVLFGGHNGDEVLGDLWVFESGRWRRLIDRMPIERVQNGH